MKKCDKCKTVELSDYEEIKFGLCWGCMSSDDKIIEDNPSIAEIKESEKFSVIVRDSNGTNFKMKANEKVKKTTVSKEEVGEQLEEDKMTFYRDDTYGPEENKTVFFAIQDEAAVYSVSYIDEDQDGKNSLKFGRVRMTYDMFKKGIDSGKYKVVDQEEIYNYYKPPKASNSRPLTEDDLLAAAGKKTTKSQEGKKEKLIEDEEGLKVVRESKEILTKSDRAKVRAYALINKALKETGNFELVVTLSDTRETVASVPFKEDSIEDIVMTTSMEVLNLDMKKKK
jgi:hypothetical protein